MMYQTLNNKYYDLFGDLYTNRALLPDKQYHMMSDALFAGYKRELEQMLMAEALKTAKDTFEMRYKQRNYIPHGIWFWRNSVSKVYKKACKEAFRLFLQGLEQKGAEDRPAAEQPANENNLPVPVDTGAGE